MIKLAIFDMDGTIFESDLDWIKIREELKIKSGENILEELYEKGSVDTARLDILEGYERANTLKTKPIKGASQLLRYLEARRIKTVLITNNNKQNTDFLLKKFNFNFDTVITREMGLWKPEPDAFFHVMDLYGCAAEEIISIGDSHYDARASQAAEITGIYIIKKENRGVPIEGSGVTYFDDLHHLKEILEFRTGFSLDKREEIE